VRSTRRTEKENEYGFVYYEGEKVSKNQKALELLGYRNEGHPGANALFGPAELGYACPICGLKNYDRLDWSEYAGFIWCPDCNLDIPSCLCVKYAEPRFSGARPMSKKRMIIRATETFLSTLESAIERTRKAKPRIKEEEAEVIAEWLEESGGFEDWWNELPLDVNIDADFIALQFGIDKELAHELLNIIGDGLEPFEEAH
jgi:hypothetical protein